MKYTKTKHGKKKSKFPNFLALSNGLLGCDKLDFWSLQILFFFFTRHPNSWMHLFA